MKRINLIRAHQGGIAENVRESSFVSFDKLRMALAGDMMAASPRSSGMIVRLTV